LALFVYTTLWNENILVLNSRIVAANATLWLTKMNLKVYMNHFVPLTDTEIK